MPTEDFGAPTLTDDQAVSGQRVCRRRQRQEDQREILRCRMCSGADALRAQDSRVLMQHLVRAHMGQTLTAEATVQLRHLDKTACRVCSGIRARTTPIVPIADALRRHARCRWAMPCLTDGVKGRVMARTTRR